VGAASLMWRRETQMWKTAEETQWVPGRDMSADATAPLCWTLEMRNPILLFTKMGGWGTEHLKTIGMAKR